MQVQGGNIMKNTITINGLAITIEGCPVQLDHVEVTSEMSAQELATSGGLIKALVGELKPLIAEAVKPVATPAPTTTTPVNNTRNNYKNNYGNNNYKNTKNYGNNNYNPGSHQRAFDALSKPAELTEVGFKLWTYEVGSYSDGNRLKVNVDNTKYDVIHINIMSAHQAAHIHIYPDTTTWHGASLETLPEMIKHMDMPEAIQAYLLKVVAL
jgi:hypothetical protein